MKPAILIALFLAMGLLIPGPGSASARALVPPTMPPKAAPPPKFQTTTWTGTLNTGDAKLRLEIDITDDAGK